MICISFFGISESAIINLSEFLEMFQQNYTRVKNDETQMFHENFIDGYQYCFLTSPYDINYILISILCNLM